MKNILTSFLLLLMVSPLAISQNLLTKRQRVTRQNKKSVSIPNNQQDRSKIREIVERIEKYVKETVQEDPPTAGSNEKRKIFVISEMHYSLTSFSNPDYELPFDIQSIVERLRIIFQGTSIPESIWSQRLQKLRTLVYQSVVEVESIQDQKELLSKQKKHIEEANRELEELKEFIYEFYKKQGYQVVTITNPEGYSPPFQVKMSTDPQGGTIKMMTYLQYRKCIILKLAQDLWPWITYNQDYSFVIGKYRYGVKWPDGRKAEGNIEITNESPVVFRP